MNAKIRFLDFYFFLPPDYFFYSVFAETLIVYIRVSRRATVLGTTDRIIISSHFFFRFPSYYYIIFLLFLNKKMCASSKNYILLTIRLSIWLHHSDLIFNSFKLTIDIYRMIYRQNLLLLFLYIRMILYKLDQLSTRVQLKCKEYQYFRLLFYRPKRSECEPDNNIYV